MKGPLEGRNAIITGGNQGLGLAIAREYVMAGANVIICARNADLLECAVNELKGLCGSGQTADGHVVDVSSQANVKSFVARAIEKLSRIHILVNNAGVYGPIGLAEENDWALWLKALEINLFGSVLMCREILPHFKTAGYGKIVQLSGGGATNPLPRFSSYAVSKAAIIRFVETLAHEVRQNNIDVNAIAPGALNTRLLDEVLAAGVDKAGVDFYNRSLQQKEQGGADLRKGAQLSVFLGSAASDGITGRLLSAVWDDWADLEFHKKELAGSDVFTLRRIVPQDRGLDWGAKK